MNRWIKILSGFALFVLGVIVCAGVLLAVVWTHPTLLVRESTLRWALGIAAPRISFRWEKMNVVAESRAWGKKRFQLAGEGVCFAQAGSSPLSGCARRFDLDLDVTVDRKDWSLRIVNLAILGFDGELASRTEKKESTATAPRIDWSLPKLPRWLDRIAFEHMSVDVAHFRFSRIENGEGLPASEVSRVSGKLTAKATASGGSRWSARFHGVQVTRAETRQLTFTANLISRDSIWRGSYEGEVDLHTQVGKQRDLSIHAQLAPKSESEVPYLITGAWDRASERAKWRVRGVIYRQHAQARVDGFWQLGRATFSPGGCELEYAWGSPTPKSGSLKAHCPISVALDRQKPIPKGFAAELKTLLSAEFRWPIDGRESSFRGRAELKSSSFLSGSDDMRAKVTADLGGDLADLRRSLMVDARAAIEVGSFANLSKSLRGSPFAVPVPFAELSGKIKASCQSRGNPWADRVDVPCQAETRLGSEQQRFDIDSRGKLVADLKHLRLEHIELDIKLKKVEAVLPYLSVQSLPRFYPDSRIRVSDPSAREPAAGPPLRYSIRVITDPDVPVRLQSNLTTKPIPLVANLHLTDQDPVRGSLRIASVDVELFRRQANLHHLHFRFMPRLDESEVNGQLRVVYADYTVNISILGQLGAPEIKYSSMPPLPEKDVMSVLLFGRKLDSLDAVESSSVGSARSAIADGAISLASMYLLASTPVESIGYDPATGVFDAKLRLTDGTSLDIGTDARTVQRVGVRKRLARNWYVTTFVQNPFEPLRQTLSTFLEWSVGY